MKLRLKENKSALKHSGEKYVSEISTFVHITFIPAYNKSYGTKASHFCSE